MLEAAQPLHDNQEIHYIVTRLSFCTQLIDEAVANARKFSDEAMVLRQKVGSGTGMSTNEPKAPETDNVELRLSRAQALVLAMGAVALVFQSSSARAFEARQVFSGRISSPTTNHGKH